MALISIKNLIRFNERGILFGPKESEEQLIKRVKTLDHFFSYPPKEVDRFLTDTDWEAIQETLKATFDIAPDWIVGHYSDKNLSFFQGAALWLTEKGEIRIPLIQLKTKFETGSLHKLYHRDEVLAHEAVHAARMQFDEPYFEEIFAYQTSRRSWRRFLGPLFMHPYEATLFLILLFLPLAYEVSFFFPIDLSSYALLRFVPFAYFAFLFGRLVFLRITLALALRKLPPFLEQPKKKWAVALRLKDRELFELAYRSKGKLKQIFLQRTSPRWRLIKAIYFKKTSG